MHPTPFPRWHPKLMTVNSFPSKWGEGGGEATKFPQSTFPDRLIQFRSIEPILVSSFRHTRVRGATRVAKLSAPLTVEGTWQGEVGGKKVDRIPQ